MQRDRRRQKCVDLGFIAEKSHVAVVPKRIQHTTPVLKQIIPEKNVTRLSAAGDFRILNVPPPKRERLVNTEIVTLMQGCRHLLWFTHRDDYKRLIAGFHQNFAPKRIEATNARILDDDRIALTVLVPQFFAGASPKTLQLLGAQTGEIQRLRITPRRTRECNRVNRHPFDLAAYRLRNAVERAFCRLKDFRAVATRYDKTARNYLAGLCIVAAIILWAK
ncbi:transposase [Brevundimonas sp. SORGH_AS 993]|nr:transposase [Brevundimonas sp. SORGH_AS_0993]